MLPCRLRSLLAHLGLPPGRQDSTEPPGAEVWDFGAVCCPYRYRVSPSTAIPMPGLAASPGCRLGTRGRGWWQGWVTLHDLSWAGHAVPRQDWPGGARPALPLLPAPLGGACWALAHQSLLLIKDLISKSLELTHPLLPPRNPFSCLSPASWELSKTLGHPL